MTRWQTWHDDYADPQSDLSRRLAAVQVRIRDWLDRTAGPVRVISACAGQGHDLVGALAGSPRAGDVTGLLVEADAHNAAMAEQALRDAGLTGLRVRCGDAGHTAAYVDAVPADLLLLCGIFGNVLDEDVRRTVELSGSLCAPGATVIWTRHRRPPDLTPDIRSWFASAGFEEVAFDSPGLGGWSVGTHRLTAEPAPYRDDVVLLRFEG